MKTSAIRQDALYDLDGTLGVDREEEIIRGFSVVTLGPVPSHQIEFDAEALDAIVRMGNEKELGVKARFGHPSMSNTALGTFLGRAKSFSRSGNMVRADLHLDTTSHGTPNGDLGKYVLDLAESDPKAFGSSMVVEGKTEWRLNKDGTRQKDKDGRELFPLFRPTRLRATDIVDEPAANKALFEDFFSGDVQLSAKFSAALDRLLEDEDAVEKALAFLDRYSRNREAKKEIDPMPDPKKEEAQAQPATQATAQLSQADLDSARKQAQETERSRVKGILSATFPGQEQLSQEYIDKGLSLEEAQGKLIADYKQQIGNKRLSLEKDHAKDLGATVAPKESKAEVPAKPGELPLQNGLYDELSAKDAWKKLSANERAEFFGDEGAYLAYVKAASRGHFRPSDQPYESLRR